MAVLLSLVVVLEVQHVPGVATEERARQATHDAPRDTNDVTTRATALDEAAILARPLFARDRRPPPPDGENIEAAHAGALPRLAGIVIEDSTRLAIFQPKQARPIVLAIGDEIAGQRIVAIDANEIVTQGSLGERRVQPLPDNAIVRVTMAPSSPPPIAIQATAPQRRGEPRPHAGVFREETGFRIIDRTQN